MMEKASLAGVYARLISDAHVAAIGPAAKSDAEAFASKPKPRLMS